MSTRTHRAPQHDPSIPSFDAHAERLQTLRITLQTGIAAIQQSDDFVRFLRAVRQFHSYSFHNVLLIMRQRPNATRVAGYKTWQSLGRQVRKGEKGIQIFAPRRFKHSERDPDTGIETTWLDVRGFTIQHVFDLSQTDGEPLPTPPEPRLLVGDDEQRVYERFVSIAQAAKLSVINNDPNSNSTANGYYSPERKLIFVRPNPPVQMCKTLLHELAHHYDPQLCTAPKAERETVAEAVAFLVAGHFGIDTSTYSFPYIAYWAGQQDGARLIDQALRRIEVITMTLLQAAMPD